MSGAHAARKSRRLRIAASLALTAGGAGVILPLVTAGQASAASVDTWEKVAQCESTGNWKANTGNGYYGGLQFNNSSWAAAGGTKYAPRADLATKDQQIATAEKLLAMQGPGAWACAGAGGLTSGGPKADVNPDGNAQSSTQNAAKPQQQAAPKAAPKPAQPKPAKPAQPAKPAPQTGGSAYVVKGGDTLHKIADAHGVEGGWKAVYDQNRKAVGGNPNVIFPGLKLTLGGSAAAPSASADQGAKPQGSASAPVKKQAAPAPAAKPAAPSAPSASTGFVRPVPGGTSTPYQASGGSWSSGSHTGVDFTAGSGTPVKSVAAGEVVKAGNGGAYGNEVVVKHADGKFTQYGHLSSISVQVGQKVGAGSQIALSGSTGNSTGPHLHFEVRTGAEYGSDIDPVSYLRAHGISV
ncbi:transglycosylase family protein [Streptomyces sp. NPDC048172]|uniref:transglycosylase family protein n=1 Tax=Streptomyces sp. NPDC048172 TaxID=3365505 RepID=UPI0037180C4F